jgi:acyl-coenzyme A synthetase/AMP-(fatty) acid ligase
MNASTLLPFELRQKLAADPTLGCGNFFRRAWETNPQRASALIWLDRPCRTFSGETFESFSLDSLKRVSDQYAAWYWGSGVREKDPVAVYMGDGIEALIHYVALTGLGAVPILINGNMPPEIAAGFLKRAGAVGLYLDREHEKAILPYVGQVEKNGLRFQVTDETAAEYGKGELPAWYPFEHVDSDPVLIGHSSGTTGIPKAVVFHHEGFFYGIRYRLGMPQAAGAERLLSALPHSHSAGIAYLMLAILAGNSIKVLSEHFGASVLENIQSFKPSMVAAFPETWVSITEEKMERYDLSTVRLWVNGGDAAHETHIRKLIAQGRRVKEGKELPGSLFIDGMGSSEMGFSLFRHVHTPDTDDYDRCVGSPLEWVDAQALGERGEKLPPGKIGKLGVRGPSVTPGYWNDSELTTRSRLKGYQLTGDMVYRDEKGRFYHVDRIPDVIQTASGPFYSLQAEELLMKSFRGIVDCSIVGVPTAGRFSVPLLFVRLRPEENAGEAEWLEAANEVLSTRGIRPVAGVVIADRSDIPLGSTGKVLKRELRDHFRDFFVREAAAAAEPVSA